MPVVLDKPLHLDLDRARGLTIDWRDGSRSFYPIAHLRKMSPSAETRALREEMARNPLTVLPAGTTSHDGPLAAVSAEMAILSLADASEAAARSIEKPTPQKISNMMDDIFAMIDLLPELEPAADTSRIGLDGWSRGGMMALLALRRSDRFRAAVLVGSMSDLERMAADRPVMLEGYQGLFGTPDSCQGMIEDLKAIGIDEIGCLIDYGLPTEMVLAHLPYLNQAREIANLGARRAADPTTRDHSIRAQIERHSVTHMQCTPSMARMLLLSDEARGALGSLRHLMIGGEAFPPALAAELADATAASITNMYGPTETTIWSTTQPVERGAATIAIGRPIANTQAIQIRMAEMSRQITTAQLMSLRLGRIKDKGQLSPTQVSLAKWNNCRAAIDIARDARDILGGAGISAEYVPIRHMLNLESVITYEGTETIHQLVVGKELTGVNAF